MIRDVILTCNQKLTWVRLIYRMEPATKKWKTRDKLRSSQWVIFSVWAAVQQLVYRCLIWDVEHRKEVVQTCWEQTGQDGMIDRAIGQFRKRLSLVVATGGGHIEHRFD